MVRRRRVSRTLASLGQGQGQDSLKDLTGQEERRAVYTGVKHTLPKFFIQITTRLHGRHGTWDHGNHIPYVKFVCSFSVCFYLSDGFEPSVSIGAPCARVAFMLLCSSHFVVNRNSSLFPHLPLEKCTTGCVLLALPGVFMLCCCGFCPSTW